ncbi:hypothetical protein BDB00DRAFT_591387 [Zychaea mexicana]|uniref:uncharacterized protein n=1 Tax=Zychaea mexicana TaxID=64656 RepID=UPI0022FE74A0|nr:uncharacterized protein BDB00DRAFT_591387 [Zychaea mexicana]KAI9497778.1 hypothetical protein BDB00DRAFT_591387 [Zychaea mexicana]
MKKKNRLRVLPFILFFSLHIHLCTFAVFLSLSLFTFHLFFIPLECPCGRARLALAHLLYICKVLCFILELWRSRFCRELRLVDKKGRGELWRSRFCRELRLVDKKGKGELWRSRFCRELRLVDKKGRGVGSAGN